LNLALTAERATELKARRDWQHPLGLKATWLSGHEANGLEPLLVPDLPGALLLPGEAWVDAESLARGLVAAAKQRGVRFIEGVTVTSVLVAGGRARGVAAGDRRFEAGSTVIAAGAWSSRIAGMPLPPDWIEPRRGQILLIRLQQHKLGHILYTHGAYVVPRSGGELIVGTTVEDAGFARVATAGGLKSIVNSVARYAPEIEAGEVVRVDAGLRPQSRDGLPLLGPYGRLPGLHLATGHFRNGILLAPLTAELVAEAIVSGRTPEALRPFLPDRVPAPAAEG
jgi:glycine oxidase